MQKKAVTTTVVRRTVRPKQQPKRAPRRRTLKAASTLRKPRKPGPPMSQDGLAFLKCAYASLDFEASQAHGVPDQYQGKSLTMDNATNVSLTPAAGKTSYIVVLPTPGVAYWYCAVDGDGVPDKTTVWTPKYDKSFNPTTGLFGESTNQEETPPLDPIDRASSVTKFRYIANSLEITSTASPNTTSGSIVLWKGDLAMSLGVQNTATTSNCEYNLNGADFVVSVPRKHYTGAVADGVYSLAFNNNVDFEWSPILSGITRIPSIGDSPDTNSATFGAWNGDFVGFGSLQALCARISIPEGAISNLVLDVRSCVEYQPNTNSIVDLYCGTSANHDAVAMQAYHTIAKTLPIAIPRAENDGFWDDRVKPALTKFLSFVKNAGDVASITAGFLGLMI
nr:putative capsid protein [Mayzas noda-like virus]